MEPRFPSTACYVVQNWTKVPILLSLKRVHQQAILANLFQLILSPIKHKDDIYGSSLVQKLMNFGVDKLYNPFPELPCYVQ